MHVTRVYSGSEQGWRGAAISDSSGQERYLVVTHLEGPAGGSFPEEAVCKLIDVSPESGGWRVCYLAADGTPLQSGRDGTTRRRVARTGHYAALLELTRAAGVPFDPARWERSRRATLEPTLLSV